MSLFVLFACAAGEPFAVTLAPTDPADTPAAVAEVVRGRLERAGAKVRAVDVVGGEVRVEADIEADTRDGLLAGLARRGRLELRPVDDTAAAEELTAHALPPAVTVQDGRACAADATALRAALDANPVADRAWLTEAGEGGAACALLVEAPLSGIDVADATTRLGENPAVELTLTPDAATRFAAESEKLVGRRLAFVVDGEAVAVPKVMEAVTGDRVEVALPPFGDHAVTDARAIATALGGDELHGPLRIVAQ